jgi:hypothetical protein
VSIGFFAEKIIYPLSEISLSEISTKEIDETDEKSSQRSFKKNENFQNLVYQKEKQKWKLTKRDFKENGLKNFHG